MPQSPKPQTSHNALTFSDALRRVGSSPLKQAAWLLRFSAVEFDALTSEERETWRQEVWAFRAASTLLPFAMIGRWEMPNNETDRTGPWRWGIMARLQNIARQTSNDLATKGCATLPKIAMELTVRLGSGPFDAGRPPIKKTDPMLPVMEGAGRGIPFAPEPAPGLLVHATKNDPCSDFIMHVAVVLQAVTDRLGTCHAEGCQQYAKLYVITKRGQRYCSPGCQARIAMRERRELEGWVRGMLAQRSARRNYPFLFTSKRPPRTRRTEYIMWGIAKQMSTTTQGGRHHGTAKRKK